MSLLVWNVRGYNKEGRKRDIMDHIHSISPSIVALVETKVKLRNLQKINSCVPMEWLSCNNFHLSDKGRIWIAWNPNVWSCVVHACSLQHITLSIKNQGGLSGYLTIVYGFNTQGGRQMLWKELMDMQITSSPWLISGDFNTARFTTEKVGGKALLFSQLSPFNDFISSCALSDLRSGGSTWTWNNKSIEAKRIAGRLDRVLCNTLANYIAYGLL